MRNAAIGVIKDVAQKDKDVLLISGDLGFGLLDTFRSELPEQYFNAGICEQNMASIAAGLALEGKKVYTYSIGNFPTMRCLEQIRNDICYHNANVKILAVGGGFAYGSLGMSHHATEDIAIMRSLPNMRVFAPADPIEAEIITKKLYDLKAPCYIRLNKGGESNIHTSLKELEDYRLGDAILVKSGKDVCLMATGAITVEAVRAADILWNKGIDVSVYSFPSIKPLDCHTVLECSKNFKEIYTIEEHNVVGGFGSAVAEVLAESGNLSRINRIGLQDIYSDVVGSQTYLRGIYGLDGESIAKYIGRNVACC